MTQSCLEYRLKNDLNGLVNKPKEAVRLLDLYSELSSDTQIEIEQDVITLQQKISDLTEDKARPKRISTIAAFEVVMKARMWQAVHE